MNQTARAYVAFGSNMGERVSQIRQAIGLLQAHGSIRVRQISRFYETEPVGIKEERDPQWFVNSVVGIDTEFTPQELLSVCLSIERRLGRKREEQVMVDGYLSRTMDIDILFYGEQVIRDADLQIPHPRLHERSFALAPMMDIAPDLVHPALQQTIREIYEQLQGSEAKSKNMNLRLAIAH